MAYLSLSKIFYKEPDKYRNYYTQRFENELTIKLPLYIHKNPSFFTIPIEMLHKMEKIYKYKQDILNSQDEIPGITILFLANKFLKDEIMLTNDIEGVQSTRKEIEDAIEHQKDNKEVRFKGLVFKYLTLIYKDEIALNTCADIRSLYDDIVLKEIKEQDIPDGKYFRKEVVQVVSATQKEKHRGLVPEKNIIEHMNICLDLLKNEEISKLLRIAIFHYYFGYIHPFYDGNGRTSRFISSYLLKSEIGTLSSLRLSYVIKNNIKRYYEAFDICNDIRNKGEITSFILMFLDLLIEGEKAVLEELKDVRQKLGFYFSRINQYKFNKSKKKIVLVLCQNALFDDSYLTIQELSKHTEVQNTTLRKYLYELEEEGLVRKEKYKNKYRYSLNLLALESIYDEIN